MNKPPYECQFCGAPSWLDESEQTAPVDYCHEGDHGEPEELVFDGCITQVQADRHRLAALWTDRYVMIDGQRYRVVTPPKGT